MITIPEKFDSTPQLVIGRIVAVNGERNADGFYPAETVSYDVDVAIPQQGIVRMRRQLPQTRLFVGAIELDAARLVGNSILGVLVMNKIRWEFVEPPALSACGAPTSRYGIAQTLLNAAQGGTVGPVQPTTPGTPGTPTAPPTGDTTTAPGEA